MPLSSSSACLARFDVDTGDLLSPPGLQGIQPYQARVEDGQIWLAPVPRQEFPPIPSGDNRVFLILGAGAAGSQAADTLRREGFGGRILMLTREAERPYDRPLLSKGYLAGETDKIHLRGEDFYREHQIEILTNSRAVGLEPKRRILALADGRQIAYDKLLLATGCAPVELNVEGSRLEGCHTLRSFADGVALRRAALRARRAVVVGASFIGLEVATSLRTLGLEVDIVAPEALPMATIFGERVGRRFRSRGEKAGVRFHLGRTVSAVTGARRVEGVRLSDGSALPADLVVVGIGVRPDVGYLSGTGLAQQGAVPVGPDLETRIPGIWAAGDLAVEGGVRVEHWVSAQVQGTRAARAMLGRSPGSREVPFFWSWQFAQSLRYVGFPTAPEEIRYRGNVDTDPFCAGYFVGGKLRAAGGDGCWHDLVHIQAALRRGEMITPEAFESGAFKKR